MDTLQFLAGPRALSRIQKQGLSANDITMVAGAAGGPKWLILAGLDPYLFNDWLPQRQAPLPLIGSSAGAWRMALACRQQADARATMTKLYIEQRYENKPSPAEVSAKAQAIVDGFFALATDSASKPGADILDHPLYRLNVITARCHGALSRDTPWAQRRGGAAAFLANAAGRRYLRHWFTRVVFQDPRLPLRLAEDSFTTEYTDLNTDNVATALLASGSIPLVMHGVTNPGGATPGMHRDGGVTDYQMDLPLEPQDGVVLLPHFDSRVISGWLDKALRWRRAQHLQDTLVVCPSAEFIASLPDQKVPCRKDFQQYFGRDDERIKNWYEVVERSQELGAELEQVLTSGTIAERLEPLRA